MYCIDTVASPGTRMRVGALEAVEADCIDTVASPITSVAVGADEARDEALIRTVATPRSSVNTGEDDASEAGFILTVTPASGWNRSSPGRGLNLLSRGGIQPHILVTLITTRVLCRNKMYRRPPESFRD